MEQTQTIVINMTVFITIGSFYSANTNICRVCFLLVSLTNVSTTSIIVINAMQMTISFVSLEMQQCDGQPRYKVEYAIPSLLFMDDKCFR